MNSCSLSKEREREGKAAVNRVGEWQAHCLENMKARVYTELPVCLSLWVASYCLGPSEMQCGSLELVNFSFYSQNTSIPAQLMSKEAIFKCQLMHPVGKSLSVSEAVRCCSWGVRTGVLPASHVEANA